MAIEKLHICTVATHETPGLKQLLVSAEENDIQIDVLGMHTPWRGCGDKYINVQKFIQNLPDSDVLLFVDAFDTLFLCSKETLLQKFLALNTPLVAGAETNCFPNGELAHEHPASPTSFKYLNSGTYMGYVGYIKQFFQEISPFQPTDNDQDLMMRHFLSHPGTYQIDTNCELFLPLFSLTHENFDLDKQKRRLTLLETKSTPCIVHGNNHSIWYQFIYNNLFLKDAVPERARVKDDKTIFISSLAKDDAHLLPKYLLSLEKLDYDKKKIDLYLHASFSVDNTKDVMAAWVEKERPHYRSITLEADSADQNQDENYTAWVPHRFKIGTAIRQRAFEMAKLKGSDYFFNIDCDNFVVPCTLKELLSHQKPIIAPLLRLIPEPDYHTTPDTSSNFFYDVTEAGDFKEHENYLKIKSDELAGTFKVPLVLGTYLINMQSAKSLEFDDDSNDAPYVVFARNARKHKIDQYLCNEKQFGLMIHFCDYPSPGQISVLKAYLTEP